jgi:hypothetical protein
LSSAAKDHGSVQSLEMNMALAAHTISPRQSQAADKRGLQTIGLLLALATVIVLGAIGLTVHHQLGIGAVAIDVPQHGTINA